jgi:hypothetical protein
VIIIDASSSAGEAQLFGKMLLMMMAVLEDTSLWTCVDTVTPGIRRLMPGVSFNRRFKY